MQKISPYSAVPGGSVTHAAAIQDALRTSEVLFTLLDLTDGWYREKLCL